MMMLILELPKPSAKYLKKSFGYSEAVAWNTLQIFETLKLTMSLDRIWIPIASIKGLIN